MIFLYHGRMHVHRMQKFKKFSLTSKEKLLKIFMSTVIFIYITAFFKLNIKHYLYRFFSEVENIIPFGLCYIIKQSILNENLKLKNYSPMTDCYCCCHPGSVLLQMSHISLVLLKTQTFKQSTKKSLIK